MDKNWIKRNTDVVPCQSVHEGTFYYIAPFSSDTIYFERSTDHQVYLGADGFSEFSIRWIDDCTHEFLLSADLKQTIEILRIDSNSYTFKNIYMDQERLTELS